MTLEGIALHEFGGSFGVIVVAVGEKEVAEDDAVGFDAGGDVLVEAAGVDEYADACGAVGEQVAADGVGAYGEASEDYVGANHSSSPLTPLRLAA